MSRSRRRKASKPWGGGNAIPANRRYFIPAGHPDHVLNRKANTDERNHLDEDNLPALFADKRIDVNGAEGKVSPMPTGTETDSHLDDGSGGDANRTPHVCERSRHSEGGLK